MGAGETEVSVFISSTFADMHDERDHLVTVVFPELRDRLDLLGLEFYDVDLRWGVPKTGVDGEKTNPWEYCQRWIDRVEPFFVCILGERYGWTEEDELPEKARTGTQPSITEQEVRYGVLDRHGSLKRSFFYLRSEAEEARVPEDTPVATRKKFIDMKATEKGQEPTEVDTTKRQRLAQLKGEIRDPQRREDGRPARDYPCRWNGDGFDDLDRFGAMVLEDLWSGVLRDERYVPRSVWQEILGNDFAEHPIYANERDPIPEETWRQVVERAKPPPKDALEAEAEQMEKFARTRLRWFRGRDKELKELGSFVGPNLPDDGSRICAVRAVPGQGKSALLATFAGDLAESRYLLITHYVGATERSGDVRWLVERLSRELERNGVAAAEEEEGAGRVDLESLRKRLASQLEEYDGDQRIVIVIDALNQLSGGHGLTWLPHRLGRGVRVVVSCIIQEDLDPQSPEARVLSALEARRPEPRWIDLSPLHPEEDVRPIIEDYLDEYCKKLEERHKDKICEMEQARNPLYLLVMLNELRTLGGFDVHEEIPTRIAEMPQKRPDTVALFAWVLERLEEAFDDEPVRRWWSYLALGRVGMASGELSELLGETLGEDYGATALRIERGIRRYLQPRGAQLDFFHGQLREAVERRYLGEGEPDRAEKGELSAADRFRLQAHRAIAGYFRRKADPSGDGKWDQSDRGLSELPYHLIEGADGDDAVWQEVHDVLTDFTFLERKAADVGVEKTFDAEGELLEETYTGIYHIKDDFDLALQKMPGDGGGPGTGGRRRIIVTGVDFGKGDGYVLRCPHCNTVHKFRDEWRGDENFECPNCKGPLKVNDFVVPPRR